MVIFSTLFPVAVEKRSPKASPPLLVWVCVCTLAPNVPIPPVGFGAIDGVSGLDDGADVAGDEAERMENASYARFGCPIPPMPPIEPDVVEETEPDEAAFAWPRVCFWVEEAEEAQRSAKESDIAISVLIEFE